MRRLALTFAVITAIISGCRDTSGIRGYWSSRTLNLEDVRAAEEEFADFAELAAKAPEREAFAAMDILLKKAGKDEVTLLVYADWIMRGFSSIASPCRSCPIFLHAADKLLSSGKLDGYTVQEYTKSREFCLHNRVGDKAELPQLLDEEGVVLRLNRRTLFLVVDQDCPSCRESLQRFLSPEWKDTALIALCYGHGPLPTVPGWEFHRIASTQTLFDTRQAPFCFVSLPDGTIEIPYKSVYDEKLL